MFHHSIQMFQKFRWTGCRAGENVCPVNQSDSAYLDKMERRYMSIYHLQYNCGWVQRQQFHAETLITNIMVYPDKGSCT